MKIVAIIPAYNEEANVARVVCELVSSSLLDEVIVIDDGSSDNTAAVAKKAGARVIIQPNAGKGQAMKRGVKETNADIIFFGDADILNFTHEHLKSLIDPVVNGQAVMTVGLRDRGTFLTWLLPKIAPVLGGERAIKRDVFLKLSGDATKNFGIETVMNAYCKKHHLPVRYIVTKGVTQVIKELKYGFWKGFIARIGMIGQIIKAEWETMKIK